MVISFGLSDTVLGVIASVRNSFADRVRPRLRAHRALRGRRPRSLIADAAMPTRDGDREAEDRDLRVTWRASVIPAPTTGSEIPTYAARNTPVSDSAIRSGGEMLITVPTAPLKIAPDPAPIVTPPAMNNASDGECSHTASTASPTPMTIAAMPAWRSRMTDQPTVRNCAATAAPNIAGHDGARERQGRMVQCDGQEQPREPGEQTVRGEGHERAQRRGEVPAPLGRRHRQTLRAIARKWRRGLPGLRQQATPTAPSTSATRNTR